MGNPDATYPFIYNGREKAQATVIIRARTNKWKRASTGRATFTPSRRLVKFGCDFWRRKRIRELLRASLDEKFHVRSKAKSTFNTVRVLTGKM